MTKYQSDLLGEGEIEGSGGATTKDVLFAIFILVAAAALIYYFTH